MKQFAYADRKDEQNQIIELLLQSDKKVICYDSEPSYGITAFFHRIMYILQTTKDTECFFSELSETVHSPLHNILGKLSVENDVLYQRIQLFTDEQYGEHEQSLLQGLLKDFPSFGETLATLFDRKKAIPIYSGFYPDVLKQVFFQLTNEKLSGSRIYIFVDNIQYIDNESIYDIIALSRFKNVKIIMSRTGKSTQLDKLLLELGIQGSVFHVKFDMPTIACVKELAFIQHRKISENSANLLRKQTNGDIRKIIHAIKNKECVQFENNSILCSVLLPLFRILRQEVSLSEMHELLSLSPYANLFDYNQIKNAMDYQIQKGLLSAVHRIDGELTYSIRVRPDNQKIWDEVIGNTVDKLLYEDIVFRYLSAKRNINLEALRLLFNLSKTVSQESTVIWAQKLLIESLQKGTEIDLEWINAVQAISGPIEQFVCAIGYFKLWRFQDALKCLDAVWPHINKARDARILYAITLNRCRKHKKANDIFWGLINSSQNNDEKAALLSFAVSNCVHSGRENTAKRIVKEYDSQMVNCHMDGYFLRNSATLFVDEEAFQYWKRALDIFIALKDDYGRYTTLTNMSRHYVYSGETDKAKETLECAYEGLMPFGMHQLHIVLNNLGIAYLSSGDLIGAKKHLRLALLIAKSIMPRAYITINTCCVLLMEGENHKALDTLASLQSEINCSCLNRLKGKYYLVLSGIKYICSDFDGAISCLDISEKYTSSFSSLRSKIRSDSMRRAPYSSGTWQQYVTPAFLEYWVISPLSIMSPQCLAALNSPPEFRTPMLSGQVPLPEMIE